MTILELQNDHFGAPKVADPRTHEFGPPERPIVPLARGQKWPILDTVIKVKGSRDPEKLASGKSGQVEKLSICQGMD